MGAYATDFIGKHALVTGASRGIGAMLAGKRTVVPGLVNTLSTFGARFLSRRVASKVATQVLGQPRLAPPTRSLS